MPSRYTKKSRTSVGASLYKQRKRRQTMRAFLYARNKARARIRRPLPLSGFPSRKIVRLRYVDRVNLNADSINPAVETFKANGMYDPRVAVGGHQPMAFDQWMALYDHFTVLGSKIHVRFCTAGSSFPAVALGIMINDTTTFPYTGSGAIESIMESSQGGRNLRMITGDTARRGAMLSRTFSAKKFFGKRDIIGESDLKGSKSADPTEGAYFQIFAVNPTTGGTDPPNLSLLVTIDYIAMLTERDTLVPS